MSHEMFALQRASEAQLDLAMVGVVGVLGSVLVLGTLLGVLKWRGRTRGPGKPAGRRPRCTKPGKRQRR